MSGPALLEVTHLLPPSAPLNLPPRSYPVVIHCETDLPSRTASSDAAAAAPMPSSAPAPGTPVPLATGPVGSPGRSPLAGPGLGIVPGIAVPGASAPQLSARRTAEAFALQHPPRPDSDRERQAQRHMVQMANWLVPDPAKRHDALFSSLILLGLFVVFAFMAGDYSFWLRTPGGIASGAPPPPLEQTAWGPRALLKWATFWRMSAETTFAPPYLFNWGARWVRGLEGWGVRMGPAHRWWLAQMIRRKGFQTGTPGWPASLLHIQRSGPAQSQAPPKPTPPQLHPRRQGRAVVAPVHRLLPPLVPAPHPLQHGAVCAAGGAAGARVRPAAHRHHLPGLGLRSKLHGARAVPLLSKLT